MRGILFFSILAWISFQPAQASCGRGWVFLDLGNTLINTSDWDHLQYMPGALQYLHELQAEGFHIGAITNVPEKWGKSDAEKIDYLKKEVAKTWIEPNPFEWSVFEKIFVPPTDLQRKPAPFLFVQARKFSLPCTALYEGEDPVEVHVAGQSGFEEYVVGKVPGAFYKPIPAQSP